MEVATTVGLPIQRVIAKLFFIGSAFTSLGAIAVGLDAGLQPTFGLILLLKGIVAAVIGGVGNIRGALLGAFLLATAENFGVWYLPSQWKDVIAFGVLILFLIFKPSGILGKNRK